MWTSSPAGEIEDRKRLLLPRQPIGGVKSCRDEAVPAWLCHADRIGAPQATSVREDARPAEPPLSFLGGVDLTVARTRALCRGMAGVYDVGARCGPRDREVVCKLPQNH